MGYRDSVEEFLTVMTSKEFVKSAIYDEAQKTLFINYYNSFEEYKENNTDTTHEESTYFNYFGTEDKIEKIVVLESARILRDFSHIDVVSMNLCFAEIIYDVNVRREKLNDSSPKFVI
jgi:hypothetical protein